MSDSASRKAAEAVVAAYIARSEGFYKVLTEDAIDGQDEMFARWAHGILGKAKEAEAFDGRQQVEGPTEDELPGP